MSERPSPRVDLAAVVGDLFAADHRHHVAHAAGRREEERLAEHAGDIA
jgi:hypothetical protein